MRLFQLDRSKDDSGVSGTGVVAEGVVFSDGSVALKWRGAESSAGFYPSIEAVEHIHGHHGHTKVVYVDD